ncbi:MAG: 30S ribosomal protein S15 [Planctomycetota bacterium]|nr:MAG: 30S ribosomal protein S15 [Planctomycetota bacterium]
MPVTKEARAATVQEFARQPGDTGSAEVQVALLTQRIDALTSHLQRHVNDVATRRGLIKMVARRNSLLAYLQRCDSQRHAALAERLGLRA